MNILASQGAEVGHQGKGSKSDQMDHLTKKPKKSAGCWGNTTEAEIWEESWNVVRWLAVIGHDSSCKEDRGLPASAENERRIERI